MQTSTPMPEQPVTLEDALPMWLCHHATALAFIKDIFFIASIWDDLIDKNKLLPDSTIHALMETTLSLPLNAFYNQYFSSLHTILHNSIRNWKAANLIEHDPNATEEALMQAFVLRSSYIDLIGMCASLIKDNTWAEHVTREARLMNSKEGFTRYKASLIQEQEIRHGQPNLRGK